MGGIECIVHPLSRIVDDIFRNALVGLFIENDMFVIIALPQFAIEPQQSYLFCNGRFIST